MKDPRKRHKNHIGWVVLVIVGGIIYITFTALTKSLTPQSLLNLIVVVISGILARLITNSAEKAAEPITNFLENIFAAYRRPYLDYLIFRHKVFETKGLSAQPEFNLELEKLFVDLQLERKLAKREARPQTTYGVWDLLQATTELDARKNPPKIILVGEPGSGKTTLLKQIALMLAKGSARSVAPKVAGRLPILLAVRDIDTALSENAKATIGEVVVKSLGNHVKPMPTEDWFMSMIRKGKCIIMLDGLDEIADPDSRRRAVEWVQEQIQEYERNHFIVTSRPFGYESNPLSGVSVFTIRPYSREQIERFIHNWYLANEMAKSQADDPGVRMRAREGADDLIARLGIRPALAALAVNPLLLTMIATVHSLKEQLPGRRVELYRDIFEVTLERRRRYVWSTNNLNTPQKIDVLRRLAYYMMTKEIRTIPTTEAVQVIKPELEAVGSKTNGEEFLKSVQNDSGLLQEFENGIYSFAHLTFQEYLASTYIINDKSCEQLLIDNVGNSWWEETIRLYAAQADATKIVEQCLAKGTFEALSLATDCLEEALKIDGRIREKIENILQEKMESENPDERAVASKAKLASRLRWMVRVSEEKYIDTSLITNIEYQLFLDDMQRRGKYYQPDHWDSDRFPKGQGLVPITGIRPYDARDFCDWLTGKDIWSAIYHLPRKDDIGHQAINGGVYWLDCPPQSDPIPFPEKSAVIEITVDEVKAQMEDDLANLNMLVLYGLEEASQKRPTAMELLDRKAIVPRSTSMAEKGLKGLPEKYYEDESLKRFKAKLAFEKIVDLGDLFEIDIANTIQIAHTIYADTKDALSKYTDWFLKEKDIKPFIFRAGLDLSTRYNRIKANLISTETSQNIEAFLRPIVPTYSKTLGILSERRWMGTEANKRADYYAQLRWFARMSTSLLGYAINISRRRTHGALQELREFLIDMVILEKRIQGKDLPQEGIRLVKETPLRIY